MLNIGKYMTDIVLFVDGALSCNVDFISASQSGSSGMVT